MVYRQQPQRSTHVDRTFPPAPPIPSGSYGTRRPSNQEISRPSSKGSISTIASNKNRARGMRSRQYTISTPSDFRRLEGAMEGTQSSGLGADMMGAIVSKPSATMASPYRPLELQIHLDGRSLSPMPTFSRPPSIRAGLPPRTSSLIVSNSRRRSLSAPIPVRASDLYQEYQKPPPIIQEQVSKPRSAPTSKLEAEIYDLDDASQAGDDLENRDEPAAVEEKVVLDRSQSFYARKGTLLLASTLDFAPPVPLKARSTLTSPALLSSDTFPHEQQRPQKEHQQLHKETLQSTEEIRDIRAVAHRSRSLTSMPKLSTKAQKPAKSPSTNSSPVELSAKEDCLRSHAQRNALQSRLSNSQHPLPKLPSKVRRSLEPRSPSSPELESRSRSNSTAKTFTTTTESKRDSCATFDSIASETSFSSMNSGVITSEKYIRTQNTEFELLSPPLRAVNRRISISATAPVPVSTLTDPPPLPSPMPRALVRPPLVTSRSTEWFASSTRPRPTMAKRSKTFHESPGLSPGLEKLGTMGYGQVVKASPKLVTVGGEKAEGRKNPEARVEWGKGLGVEWGVVY